MLATLAILIAMSMNISSFWDVESCSVVDIHGHFRESYCLYHD